MSGSVNAQPRVAVSPELQEQKALVAVRFAHIIERSRALFGLVLGGTLRPVCVLAFGGNAIAASRPSKLFVLKDDIGWGDSRACNPNSKVALPAIEHLASEGAD